MLQTIFNKIRNFAVRSFGKLERLVRQFARLFSAKPKIKKVIAFVPQPNLYYNHYQKPKAPEPPKAMAKTFTKPDDPNFRYGSGYLKRLREKTQTA